MPSFPGFRGRTSGERMTDEPRGCRHMQLRALCTIYYYISHMLFLQDTKGQQERTASSRLHTYTIHFCLSDANKPELFHQTCLPSLPVEAPRPIGRSLSPPAKEYPVRRSRSTCGARCRRLGVASLAPDHSECFTCAALESHRTWFFM